MSANGLHYSQYLYYDDYRASALILPTDNSVGSGIPVLRSGLYFLRSPTHSVIYVIYWPQDTTWDDTAISSVVRNRVTFMRFGLLHNTVLETLNHP